MQLQNAKQHHYVPVSYLKKFRSAAGLLWRFDRERQTIRQTSPKAIMYLENYNRQDHAPPGVDPNVLEIGLGRDIEQKWLGPLHRLIHSPTRMYEDDLDTLVAYLEIQRIRVPRQFEAMKEAWRREALLAATPDTLDRLVRGAATLTFHPVARINFMHGSLGRIGGYFYQMKWCVIRAGDGASFVTTDSPVTFFNPAVQLPYEPDIACAGTIVYFPLDSLHMLVMFHDPRYRGTLGPLETVPAPVEGAPVEVRIRTGERVDRAEVTRLNRIVASRSERYVVAGERTELEPFLVAAAGGLEPFVRPLDDYMRRCRATSAARETVTGR